MVIPVMGSPDAFEWPIWVYFWLGGVAGGAVAAASVANLARPGRYRRLGWLSVLLGLPLIGVGLLLLIYDLGRQERFLNLLTAWRPTSAMWWGTWILGASVAAYGLLLLAHWSGRATAAFRALERPLLWANVVVSMLLVVYTGVLLAQTSRPLWNTTWLIPALFSASALSTGVAALALLGQWRRDLAAPGVLAPLHRADEVLITLEALVLVVFLGWLRWFAGPAAQRSGDVLVSGALAAPFWIGVVAVGLVVPLLLASVRGRPGLGTLAAWASPVLVLAGGLVLRYAIVVGGQIGTLA